MTSSHILDSSAWIEILDNGPNADHFKPILLQLPNLIIPSIIITEVRKFTLRERGLEKADTVTRSLCSGTVVELNEEIARTAADLSHQHKLPLADSIIYATTLSTNSQLWTQDADFDGLPSVNFFPKTNQPTN